MIALTIDHTLGAVFIGFAVACVVYGVLVTQVFHYFRRYSLDRWVFKTTVIIILILETVDQAFTGHIIYYYTISNFANLPVLLAARTTWSLILQQTIGAIVGTIVKTYFGLRVWRFSHRNIWITGLILLLAFGQLSLAIAYSAKAFMLPGLFSARQIQVLGSISLGTGVLTDIVTAASLCYFLNRLRTGYERSDSLVNMLCSYAINTGVLTSAVSITTLILYDVMPTNNLFFVATYFILSKLYAISFMATLNTRRTIRGRGTDNQGGATTTNNTNMFHLGTRIPTLGPRDIEEQWTKVTDRSNEFPYNSFHPGVGSQLSQKEPQVEVGHAY